MSAALEIEAARALLTLREILVRHDENWKAHQLMQSCVPYIVQGRRDVMLARQDQARMVAHATEPQLAADYYTNNEHDRPYEDQYGLETPDDLFKLPRFQQVLDWAASASVGREVRILDLACNDGILAAALEAVLPNVTVDGVDLSEACIDRAHARGTRGNFAAGAIEDFDPPLQPGHDAVVLYEVIEHVPDPLSLIQHAALAVKPGGSLFVSTPNGAVERGELPTWDRVEPKGHLVAITPDDFLSMLATVGEIKDAILGPDQVLVARVTVTERGWGGE